MEFSDAAVVFEGEVLPGGREIVAATKKEFGISTVLFKVIRSYKGTGGATVEIYDNGAGTDCAFGRPAPGEKYFVYGFQGKDGKIYYEACTRTGLMETAGTDIRFARGEPGTEEDLVNLLEERRLQNNPSLKMVGAALKGVVLRSDTLPIHDVELLVWSIDAAGERTSLVANPEVDKDGGYEVRFLAAGRYYIAALDSQRTATATRLVGELENISLGQGQSLTLENLILFPQSLGRVIIRVIAPQDLHGRISIALRDSRADPASPFPYITSAHIDSRNMAVFESVPYGLYDVDATIEGGDLNRPSWFAETTQLRLNADQIEVNVEVHPSRR